MLQSEACRLVWLDVSHNHISAKRLRDLLALNTSLKVLNALRTGRRRTNWDGSILLKDSYAGKLGSLSCAARTARRAGGTESCEGRSSRRLGARRARAAL